MRAQLWALVLLLLSSNSMAFSIQHVTRSLRGGGVDSSTTASLFTSIGDSYSQSLRRNPIMTKSITASFIFALSDYIAQKFTNTSKNLIDRKRMLVSAAVGLLYFGPAAHYWYEWIFRVLPGTTLRSTLAKAALGQVFFGPTFTFIFFATSLWQSGALTWSNFARKIRNDFPSTWLAGAGFWPVVDLISYSYVPVQYIPLFVNVCSLIWTTYLVLKSYR